MNVHPGIKMAHSEATKLILNAFKAHGVEVYRIGTATVIDGRWILDGWDVQGVTREAAVLIALEALTSG